MWTKQSTRLAVGTYIEYSFVWAIVIHALLWFTHLRTWKTLHDAVQVFQDGRFEIARFVTVWYFIKFWGLQKQASTLVLISDKLTYIGKFRHESIKAYF